MACIPKWGAHGVTIGGLFVVDMSSTRDKRHSGSSTSKSTAQTPKDTRKGGRHGAGGNTRGR